MHFDWNISIGNLISIAMTIITLVYGAGRLSHILTTLVEEVKEIKRDLGVHQVEDHDSFERLNKSLLDIAMRSMQAFSDAHAMAAKNANNATAAITTALATAVSAGKDSS